MNETKPTVALVAHGVHFRGGMERAFAELVRRGHHRYHFVVLSSELDPELRALVEWRRIRVPMRPIPLKELMFALVAAVRLARARVDLVHTMGALVPTRADLATVQFCVRGFRDKTGGLAPVDSPLLRRVNTGIARRLALLLERWCYRPGRLRAFGAVSRGVAAELGRNYRGIPIELTPNGVDVASLDRAPAARAALRAENGVADGELVVLFVAGGWAHKGLAVAIEGLAEARRLGAEQLCLWVVGRGPAEQFQALAAAAGVADRVRFFGFRSDTERFFQAADLFVLPTLYESFSLVCYEAAAARLPLVATRVNGVEELLDAGAGLEVRRDGADVGSALARLAADPGLRRQVGEAGRRAAVAYGWDRSVASVLAAYRRLREGSEAAC